MNRIMTRTLLLLVLLLHLCSCSNWEKVPEAETVQEPGTEKTEISISEHRHLREDGYPADFRTYCLTNETCTVHMERSIYEEALLRSAAGQLSDDLAVLSDTVGAFAEKPEIYLVRETITGNAQATGNRMFCSLEALHGKAYRQALIQAAYQPPKMWQSVGLSELAFGTGADTDALVKFYEDDAHQNVLSLFPMYFLSDFADQETVSAAVKTAVSVAEYWLRQHALEEFLHLSSTAEAVAPWAANTGISAPALPDGSEQVDALQIVSIEEQELVLQANGEMNRFRFELHPTDWISEAEAFYPFLCLFYAGYEDLLDEMKALPISLPQIQENAEQGITVKLIESDEHTYANAKSRTVYIAAENSIWHEVTHVLLPNILGNMREDYYLSEGLTTFFAAKTESKHGMLRSSMLFEHLTNETLYPQEEEYQDEIAEQKLLRQYYTGREPLPESPDELIADWFYRACGITTLLHPDLYTDKGLNLNHSVAETSRVSSRGDKTIDPNDLTPCEVILLVDYLSEQYGLDHVVSNHLNYASFEEAYGMPYSACYPQFLQWVQEKYGEA